MKKIEIVTKSQKPFLYQFMDQKNSVNKRSLKNISNESTHTKGIAIIAHIYSNILNIFLLGDNSENFIFFIKSPLFLKKLISLINNIKPTIIKIQPCTFYYRSLPLKNKPNIPGPTCEPENGSCWQITKETCGVIDKTSSDK